jgi:hypothetical protein
MAEHSNPAAGISEHLAVRLFPFLNNIIAIFK